MTRVNAPHVALLAVLLAASSWAVAQTAPAALLNKLSALAGSGSRDCGSVPLHADRNAAIACAKGSSASGTAYRVAFQLPGTDSESWQGAARNGQGKLWVAFYDLDSSAGSTSSPTLSSVPCREILFAARGDEALDCQPISGRP